MDSKWYARSLTMWGAAVTSVSVVIPAVNPLLQLMFGFEIEPGWLTELDAHIKNILSALGGIGGLIMIVVGRIRAIEPLRWSRKP